MKSDMEQKIKEKVLMDLINQLDDWESDRLKPAKGLSVEVAAPDKEKLADGLDKAKEVLEHSSEGQDEASEPESDEDRLRALLADSDEDDEDEMR